MKHNIVQQIRSILSADRKRELVGLLIALLFATAAENLSVLALSVFGTSLLSSADVTVFWWYPYLIEYVPSLSQDVSLVILATGTCAVGMVALKHLIGAFVTYYQASFATKVEVEVGNTLLQQLAKVRLTWFHDKNTSELTLTAQWRQYIFNYLTGCIQLLLNGITCVGLLCILFYSNAFATLFIGGTCVPIGLLLFWVFKRRMHDSAQTYANCCSEINEIFFCAIQGARELRIFQALRTFLVDFRSASRASVSARRSQYLFTYLPTACFELVAISILVLTIFLLFSGIIQTASTQEVTEMLAILGATAWRLLPSINKLIAALSSLKASQPFVEATLALLDEITSMPAKSVENRHGAIVPEALSQIELQHICFKYSEESDKEAISDMNLRLVAGQSVGVVGASGAGKSTFANILLGLYEPTSGDIFLDNTKLTNEIVGSWTKKIGYVPQEPFLRNGTLLSNIAYGVREDEIELEKAVCACEMASIDFVPLTKEGLSILVGEHGVKFSGGQRQRIAIARALYQKPSVLIFDEATSALDDTNEASIIDTVYELSTKVTLIMIAHRVSTLERCDRILVMDKGQIVADGSPAPVLRKYCEGV